MTDRKFRWSIRFRISRNRLKILWCNIRMTWVAIKIEAVYVRAFAYAVTGY